MYNAWYELKNLKDYAEIFNNMITPMIAFISVLILSKTFNNQLDAWKFDKEQRNFEILKYQIEVFRSQLMLIEYKYIEVNEDDVIKWYFYNKDLSSGSRRINKGVIHEPGQPSFLAFYGFLGKPVNGSEISEIQLSALKNITAWSELKFLTTLLEKLREFATLNLLLEQTFSSKSDYRYTYLKNEIVKVKDSGLDNVFFICCTMNLLIKNVNDSVQISDLNDDDFRSLLTGISSVYGFLKQCSIAFNQLTSSGIIYNASTKREYFLELYNRLFEKSKKLNDPLDFSIEFLEFRQTTLFLSENYFEVSISNIS